MRQLIHDPDFWNSAHWKLNGLGVTLPGGSLEMVGGIILDGRQRPERDAIIGRRYDYFVDATILLAVSFRLYFGGEVIYDKATDPAGIKTGFVIASDTDGLSIRASNVIGSVDFLSVTGGYMGLIDYNALRVGIRTHLLAVPSLPASRSWENREFTAPKDTPWIQETLLPGQERQTAADVVQGVGVMQYDLYWPKGDGTSEPEAMADAIKGAFPPVTAVGANAVVYRTERFGGRIEDERWYRIPIRLTYRAHAIG